MYEEKKGKIHGLNAQLTTLVTKDDKRLKHL